MRIYAKGIKSYTIDLDGTENPEFRQILEGWLDALEYHEYKSRGYKRRDMFSLGIKGEFVGFWRKAQKLLPLVWESKTLTGEGTQEVLMDTFGSVGLMLHALRQNHDKYSARWRDNHNNKPTFGPGPNDVGGTVTRASGGTVNRTPAMVQTPNGPRVLQEGDTVQISESVPITFLPDADHYGQHDGCYACTTVKGMTHG